MAETDWTVVRRAACVAGTWAGGATMAALALPPGSLAAPRDALAWVGWATIERPAPYSFFAGRTRLHVPVRGGLRLRFGRPDETVELAELAPIRFDAERPLEAEPLGGPVLAWNLVAHRSVAFEAAVLRGASGSLAWPAPEIPPAPAARPLRLISVVRGALRLPAGAELAEGDTLADAAGGPPPELWAEAADAIAVSCWLPAR